MVRVSPPLLPVNAPLRNAVLPPLLPVDAPRLNAVSPPLLPVDAPLRNAVSPPLLPVDAPLLNAGCSVASTYIKSSLWVLNRQAHILTAELDATAPQQVPWVARNFPYRYAPHESCRGGQGI